MANEKIIAQDVFEKSIKDILQIIADKVYDLVPYTSENISEILEISDQEAMELTKIINDNVVANNKLWSSNKTNNEIQNAIIEANKYADELIGQISSISLEYVTTLPTSDIKSNVIYILQGTPNTLNVYNESTSSFVSVGNLDFDFSTIYTKSDVDTLLADKADDNTVVHQDDVVSDMTTTSGTTVLSTSGLKTELDKKANDDEVLKTTNIATTIDNTVTDEQIASARAVLRSKSATRMDESVNPENYEVGAWFAEGHDSISLSTSDGHPCSEWHIGYVVTGYKASDSNGYKIILAIAMSGNCYIKVQQWDKWTKWINIGTTSVADVPVTTITNTLVSTKVTFQAADSNAYLYVKNGTCYVSIWDVTILEEANLEVLFNNAPKAAFMVGCALHNGYESFGHVFVTTNSTEIRLNAPSGLAGKSGYCSFSYPVAEP